MRSTSRVVSSLLAVLIVLFGTCPTVVAQQQPKKPAYVPFVAPASDEGEEALQQFKVPPGFKVELFAAEPRMANPVAFYIDEQNRFYVVETFRRKKDVIDIRGVMHWLDDDTASRTVAARNAMIKKYLTPAEVSDMTRASERLRRIEDRDGDGKADFDTVFADGFNRLEDGIAAGVLARGEDVFFACLPSLWRLRDTNNDGIADQRDELHYGYGVRYNFNGHDLHGLRFGPDGKLYFSMGDRGLHVEKTPDGRVVSDPDTGAVLRCNPDGTELEIFHDGLRNPQELAFDDFGNLFTGDNNSDAGDMARWVYVVEGGDSGWRTGYQNQEWPVSRGPWNHEGIWMAPDPHFPAYYIVPPVAELPEASGPSGLTRDPGTGLPEEFRGRFFLADFRGGPGLSSVHAIQIKPKGATFEVVEQKPVISNLLCTDVEIGWDGMYVSDWTNGWVTTGKGRLYRLFHEQAIKDPLVAETRKLMSEGMAKRPPAELAKLLGHADQRVRQAAQFELAGRGEKTAEVFTAAVNQRDQRLARLHGIWGLGQLARKSPDVLKPVLPLLKDQDDEVRTQAAKVLGDAKYAAAGEALLAALADPSDRVRFYAAMGVGKVRPAGAGERVLAFVRENGERDGYLRHAGVMALTWLNDRPTIAAAAKAPSRALRMAALLTLRRLKSPDVAMFLDEKDPDLVLEAARAINDVPIEPAMPKLAAAIGREGLSDPVVTRVLNANWRAGTPEAAAALANFVKGSKASEQWRIEALRMLGAWEQVPGRDRITGNWRPLPPRDAKIAKDAAGPVLPDIVRTAPDAVRVVAVGLLTRMGVGDPALLTELAGDKKLGYELRAAALAALADSGDARLDGAVDAAMKDPDERIRAAGVRALAKLPGAIDRLAKVLNGGSTREQQAAMATLAALPGDEADKLIIARLDRMLAGDSANPPVPKEVHLDVLEAAAARKSASVAAKLEQYTTNGDQSHPLAPYRETLYGGDATIGERIFRERADVSCLRCHSISKKGGNAGPDLVGLGKRADRTYMLESIILPGKVISPGYETVAVRTKDGTAYAGILKKEDATSIKIDDPGKSTVTIEKSQIKSRRGGMSSMPDNIKDTLSKQDVRNLVEFLASLTSEPTPDDSDKRRRTRDSARSTGAATGGGHEATSGGK